ncbi:MAG: SxtJ family membrane protein [Planctomycetota bacterium]
MIAPNWYPEKKQLRQFAVAALFGFGLLGYMFYHEAHWPFHQKADSPNAAYTCWIIGGVTMLLGLASPYSVRPLYVLLMALTLPLGLVISAVLLRVIFYGFVTPLGLFFRLIGRDALRLKKPVGASFWIDHRDRPTTESYFRQA